MCIDWEPCGQSMTGAWLVRFGNVSDYPLYSFTIVHSILCYPVWHCSCWQSRSVLTLTSVLAWAFFYLALGSAFSTLFNFFFNRISSATSVFACSRVRFLHGWYNFFMCNGTYWAMRLGREIRNHKLTPSRDGEVSLGPPGIFCRCKIHCANISPKRKWRFPD